MPSMWLPKHVGERYDILRRLRALNTFVPGADQLDVSHLRDILQAQEAKAGEPTPPKPVRTIPKEQVAMGLRDYLDFLRAQKEGRRRIY